MANTFRIEVTDFYKFSDGQLCLIGIADPKEHKVITSKCKAKIVVDNSEEFPLNIIGQDLISRSVKTEKNEQTILRTKDELGDILKHLGKKSITIIGQYPG